MASNSSPGDPRSLWQSQPPSSPRFSAAELAAKAARFERRISARNLREYVAAAVVVVVFGLYILWFRHPLMRLGSALTIAAAVFVSWHLNRRGSAKLPPAAIGLSTCVDAYRSELEQQRDLLRGVWLWYLAPFLPGLLFFFAGSAMSAPGGLARVGPGFLVSILLCLCVFVGIGYLNHRAARALQVEIDQLNEMEKSS